MKTGPGEAAPPLKSTPETGSLETCTRHSPRRDRKYHGKERASAALNRAPARGSSISLGQFPSFSPKQLRHPPGLQPSDPISRLPTPGLLEKTKRGRPEARPRSPPEEGRGCRDPRNTAQCWPSGTALSREPKDSALQVQPQDTSVSPPNHFYQNSVSRRKARHTRSNSNPDFQIGRDSCKHISLTSLSP